MNYTYIFITKREECSKYKDAKERTRGSTGKTQGGLQGIDDSTLSTNK